MLNKHFNALLEKYKIALERLTWALGELDKKPKEIIIEDTAKLDELSKEIRNLIAELDRKDEIIASLQPINLSSINDSLSLQEDDKEIVPTFGSEFPQNPELGHQFLRVDMLPNQLFKYNGTKWIKVDKNHNTSYTINKKLAEHMIIKLKKGELDWEDLTDAEREAIKPYLAKETNLGR